MKTTILWDHDGVLVDTEPWYFAATQSAIKPLGVDLEQAAYLADMAHGKSAWERAKAIGASDQDVALHKARRDELYRQYLRTEDIEIEGVLKTLATLAQSFQMAIITTSKRIDFELIHAERQIVDHMSFVLCSGDYPRSKPHPDPYLAGLERFAVSAEETLVVEDSERGLTAAVAAGIDCVVVANAFVRGQDLSKASYFVDSIGELPELLKGL
ncbi:MAG: HAD family phosphatase [Myxococcales bacterium]|nr:HAD family phosphatase [Myxococcales bacterium]